MLLKKVFFYVLQCSIEGHSFFSECSAFFYFKKVAAVILPQLIPYFWEEHLEPWIGYIQCVWQIFKSKAYYYFNGALAALHLRGNVIVSGGHFQLSIIFMDTVVFLNNQLESSLIMLICNLVAIIHSIIGPFSKIVEQFQPRILSNWLCHCTHTFFYKGVIISRDYLKRSIC